MLLFLRLVFWPSAQCTRRDAPPPPPTEADRRAAAAAEPIHAVRRRLKNNLAGI